MIKKEFEKLKQSLIERGYVIYSQQWHHEDYVIGKSFHKDDNKWEEGRAAYQILISVYDYTLKSHSFYDRLPRDIRNKVGLEIHVDMSRTIDERLDFTFDWKDSDTIEEIEHLAEEYYNFMCRIIPEPRGTNTHVYYNREEEIN